MDNKDKLFKSLYILICLVFVVIVFTLISFFFDKKDVDFSKSEIPILQKERLENVITRLNNRQDIDTFGKPDTDKFIFKNEEPFR